MDRRDFLRTGLAGGAAAALSAVVPARAGAAPGVAIVADPDDAIASSRPAEGARDELRAALTAAGHPVRIVRNLSEATSQERVVLTAGGVSPAAASLAGAAHVTLAEGPERLALIRGRHDGRDVLLAWGSDPRGLSYALTGLADRVRRGNPDALEPRSPAVTQAPATPVRSVMRQFTSETLDKPWFHDRAAWPDYLSMLARYRFNRLHLAFGLGYDSLVRVADSYLLFAYPFLVDVPGYSVRVTNLADAERDRNLAMLRYISDEAVRRGLTFQLGLWMHGYALTDSPNARYVVEGLDQANHAAYCRDALTTVLKACPSISAVALRIHGESGIAEGSYDFWQTVFTGVPNAGRSVEIDLHAKGLDHAMIGRALSTGMPVNVSPKYWAEHLGLPYHQAAIREVEMPVAGRSGSGLMTLSEGSLSFTRYGYADFLRDDRRYTVRHRVFSGTQRLLLSGDPEWMAAYARAFTFCGSAGVDLMEPLTCRGRRGTGIPGTRRSGYIDASLEPPRDWQKYDEWYRLSGRLTYDPDDRLDPWQPEPGEAGRPALASALARASRVLPIVTTAYTPSAACDAYWPEVYWNQPLVSEPRPNPYGDTKPPKTFPHASPLDPRLFTTMAECAAELVAKQPSGRYTSIEAAQWLEDLADDIERDLSRAGRVTTPAERRLTIDTAIQADLARFFAARFRAGVLYAIYEATGDREALQAALDRSRAARQAWQQIVERTRPVYAPDLSASDKFPERGQWADRLAGIDADIAAVQERLDATVRGGTPAVAAIAAALGRPSRPAPAVTHASPGTFQPGQSIALAVTPVRGRRVQAVQCCYRHVNQAERFVEAAMTATGSGYTITIPPEYTTSPYPLQYYFLVTDASGARSLLPGLGAALTTFPYYVLHRA
jgi:hypothetical protein